MTNKVKKQKQDLKRWGIEITDKEAEKMNGGGGSNWDGTTPDPYYFSQAANDARLNKYGLSPASKMWAG